MNAKNNTTKICSIDGYPGYLVTSLGQVLSARTARGTRQSYKIMSPRKDKKGYVGVILCGENRRRSIRIHRLVAEAFIQNPQNHPCVRHRDGIPANNIVSNLEWGTYKQNENDKIAHGTYDTRRNGKLGIADREFIFILAKNGFSQKDIADRFNVSRPAISRLLNGTTWTGLKCAN